MDPEKRIFLCPLIIRAFLSYVTLLSVSSRLRNKTMQSRNQVEADLTSIFFFILFSLSRERERVVMWEDEKWLQKAPKEVENMVTSRTQTPFVFELYYYYTVYTHSHSSNCLVKTQKAVMHNKEDNILYKYIHIYDISHSILLYPIVYY